jgi:ATP-dependent RNA helicase SUPV3L1/SUV3
VTVEGHLVSRLAGVHFEPERGATALENRALRGAVERVVAPEVARRLGALASEDDQAFALAPGGVVNWRGEAAGEIVGGEPFAPRVRLIGGLGAEPQRERAARRLEAFAATEATRRLSALKHLKDAIEDGRLRGLARGLAYQLVEQFGALDRRAADARVRLLSRNERRTLKTLGVRFGAFSLYLPALLTPEGQGVAAVFAELAAPGWRAAPDRLTALPQPPPPHQALALRGLRAVAGLAAPVEALERLDALIRAAPQEGGAWRLPAEVWTGLGWEPAPAERIMRALGFMLVRKADAEAPGLWRRRGRPAEASPALPAALPRTAPARGRRRPRLRQSGGLVRNPA